MNRKIKFRAWCKEEERMFEPRLMSQVPKTEFWAITENIYEDGEFKELDTFDTPKRPTLMQFTGLTDKNGQEIYEGDIIRLDYTNGGTMDDKKLVEWDEEKAGFIPFIYRDNPSVRYATDPKKVEVIGNKFEDEDLLCQ